MNTAVILAGGKSRRMGHDKLVLRFDGKTLLQMCVNRFSAEFDTVMLSVAEAGKYPEIKIRRVVDTYPGAGPLSGLHAALLAVKDDDEGVFLTAADLPFAQPHAAKRITQLCGDSDVCVIRQTDGRVEPLFAYYRKSLLGPCEKALESGERRMTSLISGANARFVSPEELSGLWDDRLLLNINYPDDYEKIQKQLDET